MEDLGQALAVNKGMLMLGGGNPAHIPEVESVLKSRMQNILDAAGALGRVIGDYSPPQEIPRSSKRWPISFAASTVGT